MKRGTIVATMIIVLVLAFLAGLSSSTVLLKSSSISTMCTIPDEGAVVLQVLNSTTGKPIAFAPVFAQFVSEACSQNSYTAFDLNTTMTNATGYAVFAGELGEYHLNLHTLGNYFVDVSNPGETACVTLSIPSGETQITYSGYLESSCQSAP